MTSANSSKSTSSKSIRRREGLKRLLARPSGLNVRSLVLRPEVVLASLVAFAFVVTASALVIWSREQVLVAEGRIMTHTRVNRVDFTVEDEAATKAARDEAGKSSPRVYRLNESLLNRLSAEIDGLPAALMEKTDLPQVGAELRLAYALDNPASLTVLQAYGVRGQTDPQWSAWTLNFVRQQLGANPLIGEEEWEKYTTTFQRAMLNGGRLQPIGRQVTAHQILPEQLSTLEEPLTRMANRAGFPDAVVRHIVARVLHDPQPTLVADEEQTRIERERRVAAVVPVEISHARGDVIYGRGEVLNYQQVALLNHEAQAYRRLVDVRELWLPRLAAIGLVALVTMLIAGYVTAFYPRIARNVLRVAALAALQSTMLALSAASVAHAPDLLYLAAVAPTLLVAIAALLAYDHRLALFLSAVQGMFVNLALDQGPGLFILLFTGCATMIGQLRDLRHRNALIRAAAVTAAVLGLGTILHGLLVTPAVSRLWAQLLFDASCAIGGSFAVGFLALGILPSIEQLFDITTGMTLAELRDPKHPLLRQLQQKAPGTYNHSLQVANIAEAAAEAIGANGLLVYVGSLYHDIGKINKPEYFIENQAGGYNKHDRLTPAMSLLILVGHVKDGVELAREYGLPRLLHHFIESHHGTTLVEYFYHAAKTRAQAQQAPAIEEFEFRYPGPKPQTREAAILMIADVVESATRTMAEPNPGRIENLVRRLSRKRLNDGQFDRCDLTFRELSTIEDSIIKSVCAIYHGRISYPTGPSEPALPIEPASTPAPGGVRQAIGAATRAVQRQPQTPAA